MQQSPSIAGHLSVSTLLARLTPVLLLIQLRNRVDNKPWYNQSTIRMARLSSQALYKLLGASSAPPL